MKFISRLTHRPARSPQSQADIPLILIAERFITPYPDLDRIDMPDDLQRVAPGADLDGVVLDEFGTLCRRVRLAAPPEGTPGTRIEFAPMPIGRGARLWLFVIDAGCENGDMTPGLVDALLVHARRLGGRPPITLLWDQASASPVAEASAEVDLVVAEPPPPPSQPGITFAMLSEDPDPALLPPLDQPEVDVDSLTPEQRAWRQDGVVILREFMPDWLLDPYIEVRRKLNEPGGWLSPTPYMHVEELRRLCLYPPLRQVMRALVGEEMMLHLNLTGWVTTERDWHQDDYLNPAFVNSWYAAVWVALDHIHPDSGPFEYVPGSQRWRLLRGDKVKSFMTKDERPDTLASNGGEIWPWVTERFVAPAVDYEIYQRGIPPRQFLAEKGDVLIWHGRLLHRGTLARRPGLERRAVIAHYSGVNHRPDMPVRRTDDAGGVYAVFDRPLA